MVKVYIVFHGIIWASIVREWQSYVIFATITSVITWFSRFTEEAIAFFQRSLWPWSYSGVRHINVVVPLMIFASISRVACIAFRQRNTSYTGVVSNIDIAFNIKIYCNTQSGIERFIGWLRFITIKICVSEVKSFIVIINGGIGYVQSEYVTIVPIVVKVSSDSVIEIIATIGLWSYNFTFSINFCRSNAVITKWQFRSDWPMNYWIADI